ncbi:MAG: phosphate propanoyltransferase [Limnochordia bacterium]|nr:phosphate propanoyltransferase [Bacillota bacterium]HOB07906.1 phosphate propanoyltransferase [Limnochordia bacterium]NLH31199.1 phosphate propanoyltransferase [Bacillota bacterium]HPT93437.1 phosphate propanoyltransferase [Limnochordia bacterium]HPZ29941.1 phosphate propanoyltransferase [Limnochordia bacterium]
MKQFLGKVPVGVSARHLHLSKEDLAVLFGPDYQLTPAKELSQTGQYAAEEQVTLVTRKNAIPNVRVLGPLRGKTQVEISRTDAFALGLRPPVRDSGSVENSEAVTLVGPKGSIYLKEGVIIALRHIHMSPADAAKFGVEDKSVVSVKTEGERSVIFNNVLVRVRDDFVLEFHIDTDEANAAGLNNGDLVEVYK